MSKVRPDWDKTWMDMAGIIAKRSLCSRDQVGAVIVDQNQRIVSTGYNGPPSGFRHDNVTCDMWCTRARPSTRAPLTLDPSYGDCPSLHAEANALLSSERSARLNGYIYVTSDVCFACAKLIANSGLSLVVYTSREQDTHRNPERSYQFLERLGITVVRLL